MSTTSDDLIATATAAEIIGISREGVRWMTRTGRLQAAIVLATGHRLYSRAEVERFARARRARVFDQHEDEHDRVSA